MLVAIKAIQLVAGNPGSLQRDEATKYCLVSQMHLDPISRLSYGPWYYPYMESCVDATAKGHVDHQPQHNMSRDSRNDRVASLGHVEQTTEKPARPVEVQDQTGCPRILLLMHGLQEVLCRSPKFPQLSRPELKKRYLRTSIAAFTWLGN